MSIVRVLMINPPSFSIDQPYISTPAITAFLKTSGFRVVDQFDANLDSFYYVMRKGYLKNCVCRIKQTNKDLERNLNHLSAEEKKKYQFLCEAILFSSFVIRRINEAIRYFRNDEETNIQEYNFYKNVIDRALDIVSATHYPTLISLRSFSMRFSNQSLRDIVEATKSPENPYVEYYSNIFHKRVLKKEYDVCGISVTALSQIIPSFTLASFLKKKLPHVKVVFGGQVFNRLEENIRCLPHFFDYVDYTILGEGETAFLNLLEHLAGKKRLVEVPNLLFYDKTEGKVVENDLKHSEDVLQIPTPDYSGLKLSKYLARSPVLSYQPGRGCYWSRCTFCNQFLVTGKGLRCKTSAEIVEDLKNLTRTYKTRYFSLVNESLPPKVLKEIAQLLIAQGMALQWYAGARFDKGFDIETLNLLKQSGCEKLYFGLESGSQNVLDKMNKGTNLGLIKKILKNTKEADIGVHLFIMIGFPTETVDDFKESRKLIYEALRSVDLATFTYYVSIYQLKPQTSVFNTPCHFNIKTVFRRADCDLEYLFDFEKKECSTKLDNELKKRQLEETMDVIVGRRNYPENVCHYLTFKPYMKERSKTKNGDSIYINPYLVGKRFKGYNSRYCSYLLYDFLNDNLFETPDIGVHKLLLTTKRGFRIQDFEEYGKMRLRIKDDSLFRSFAQELLGHKLLLKGGNCHEKEKWYKKSENKQVGNKEDR